MAHMIDKADIKQYRAKWHELQQWLEDNTDAELHVFEDVAREQRITSKKIRDYEDMNTPHRIRNTIKD